MMQLSPRVLCGYVVLALMNTTECTIYNWTKPLILTPEGSATLNEKINDGASSATGITIQAYSSPPGTYTLESQTPSSPDLAISSSTGVVTVTSGTVSYSSVTSFTLIVSVTDDGGSTNSTATVTLLVNAAPTFPSYSSNPCIEDGADGGTELITLSATDSNSDEITYSLVSGNTYSHFVITTAGVVTVNFNPLDKANTSSYTLVITATDDSSTPLTATATVTATVSSTCSDATILSISFMTIFSAFIGFFVL